MKQLVRNLTAALLAAAWMLALTSTALAAELPEKGKIGSISIEMQYNKKSVTGGTLQLYRVGDVQCTDGDFGFSKAEAFSSFSGSVNNLNDAALAGRLWNYIQSSSIQPVAAAENKTGSVVFSDLPQGLYLVAQGKAASGFSAISPFLISVPMRENGTYLYDVSAASKFELTQTPVPSPTPESKLPQTGQLNWPIPFMAAVGMALILLGCGLKKRRTGHA